MEAIGPLLVIIAIPLILRWIPPNRYFGFRIPATLHNASVWYDVNALFGRHTLMLGLLMVALEFVLPRSMRTVVLASIGWIGFFAITAADWRTANRWRRERAGRETLGRSAVRRSPIAP